MSEVFCIFSKLLLRGCENNTSITPSGFFHPLSCLLFCCSGFQIFLSAFLWGRICSFQLLGCTASTNPWEGLFPGRKDMFIFAVEIASLFPFLFPSLCFLGFHNNNKKTSFYSALIYFFQQNSYFVSLLFSLF